MSFLLDADTCSFHLKRPSGLIHRFIQHSGRLYLSTISLAELYAWAYRRPKPSTLLHAINQDLLTSVTVLDFNADCAEQFGMIRGDMLTRNFRRRTRLDDRVRRPGAQFDVGNAQHGRLSEHT